MKVKYKGSFIVDDTETTKTLLTKGKYCEDDIEITAEGGSELYCGASIEDTSLPKLDGKTTIPETGHDVYISSTTYPSTPVAMQTGQGATSSGIQGLFFCGKLKTFTCNHRTAPRFYGVNSFSGSTVEEINFPNLTWNTSNEGAQLFYHFADGCTKLKKVSMPLLEIPATASAPTNCFRNMFTGCIELEEVDMHSLTFVPESAYIFNNCKKLKEFPFKNVKKIGAIVEAFSGCNSFVNVSWDSLDTITGSESLKGCFKKCENLETLSFPLLQTCTITNCFYDMVMQCEKMKTISFDSLESGVTNGSTFTQLVTNCPNFEAVYLPKMKGLHAKGCGYMFMNNAGSAHGGCDVYLNSFTEINGGTPSTTTYLFIGCTHLRNVYMHSMKTPPRYMFDSTVNTRVQEIHFSYSNTESIKESDGWADVWGLGASAQSKVFFDLNRTTIDKTNVLPANAVVYIDGVAMTDNTQYISTNEKHNIVVSASGYPVYGFVKDDLEPNVPFVLDVDLSKATARTLSFSVIPSDATVEVMVGGTVISKSSGDNYIIANGSGYEYSIKKKGYKTVSGDGIITSDLTITVTMEQQTEIYFDLSYPFDSEEAQPFLSEFIKGTQFVIDSTDQAIINGSSSYHVNNGESRGYIKFKTPDDGATHNVSIVAKVNSEASYDYGFCYLDTELYTPTRAQVKAKTIRTGSSGVYLCSIAGSSGAVTNYTTYSATCQPNTVYYLHFGYLKDGSGNTGQDKFYIQNIKFDTQSEV